MLLIASRKSRTARRFASCLPLDTGPLLAQAQYRRIQLIAVLSRRIVGRQIDALKRWVFPSLALLLSFHPVKDVNAHPADILDSLEYHSESQAAKKIERYPEILQNRREVRLDGFVPF